MAILADSYRILKPGGHIIITVPAFMWLWTHNDDLNAHVRRYTANELKQKLTQTGFKIRRVSYNNFFVFPLAAHAAPASPFNRCQKGVGLAPC